AHHREDCCVSPDAQREREHGHGGEAGIFQQLAEGEFEIVHGPLSVVSGQWSGKAPNPKVQVPNKSQTPNSKQCISRARSLEFGNWSFLGIWTLVRGAWIFSGVWILVFGVFIRISAPPSDRF